MGDADPDAIHAARRFVVAGLGAALYDDFLAVRGAASAARPPDDLSTEAMGARALANAALRYLAATGRPEALDLAGAQARRAASMTLAMGGLSALNDTDCPQRDAALAAFHDRWRDRPMELDKWFALKAVSALPDTLAEVGRLLDHPGFDIRNPNRARALVGNFASGNPVRFHAADGAGHRFLADRVLELDPLNPMVAARLLQPMTRWRRYRADRRRSMTAQLERVVGTPGLSKDVYEIASKALG